MAELSTYKASTTEVLTGTLADHKHVSPDALAALWEKGSDIASAGTISVGEGGYFNVTGTTTITDIDFATDKAGRRVWLKFAGILTLTHHATSLILPTGASITTAAGDVACFVSEGSDNVRCISYTRADGTAVGGGGGLSGLGASDNRAMRTDGTGGGTAQGSDVEIDDSGNIQNKAGNMGISAANSFNSVFLGDTGGAVANTNSSQFKAISLGYGQSGTDYAQITANQNNYAINSYNGPIYRLNTDASRDMTGLVLNIGNGSAYTMIVNVGSNNLVLKHEDANSTASNRFLCSTGADITLAANQAADLYYDNTSARWRVYKKN